jgi:phosphoenolpyruvate carboxykinase (GTP)
VTSTPNTTNAGLKAWVDEIVALCRPASVRWCDGSKDEHNELCALLVRNGTFIKLDDHKRPGSFLARSDPSDVARVEERTFICSPSRDDAGPTNNWHEPEDMKRTLRGLFAGCMQGRTMYVIPFCMGPVDSPKARIAVQITDSPYVVVNMGIMTRMGKAVLQRLGDGKFIPCLHSVGVPLKPGQADRPWPCNAEHKYIVHFPQDPSIWSFGSGYGGNALLGKKSLALRIASALARNEGWMAEHMLIMALKPPKGPTKYIAAAFPSACGKTNLAMLKDALPGWKVHCVGDDIAWMWIAPDGRLRAINPEAGFFGVAPGTSPHTNPYALATIARDTIFTNVALTPAGDVWWEKLSAEPPAGLIDWRGRPWSPDSGEKAAHPNARYTTHASYCPIIDPAWEDPFGVPISAILFGGRRAKVMPLVMEALSWEHGVFLGSQISSETTAAAGGEIGKVRRDPFAMLPFCGYHMADYFAHWLQMGRAMDAAAHPKIFYVNWFRKDAGGQYLWPGFGENARVLKWIYERTENVGAADATPIGYLPSPHALDISGLKITDDALRELLQVDVAGWLSEAASIADFYKTLGDRLPRELKQELDGLQARLAARAKGAK